MTEKDFDALASSLRASLPNDDAPTPEEAANARLIATTPRLLNACRAVVANWEHGDLAAAVRECSAAIDEAVDE